MMKVINEKSINNLQVKQIWAVRGNRGRPAGAWLHDKSKLTSKGCTNQEPAAGFQSAHRWAPCQSGAW